MLTAPLDSRSLRVSPGSSPSQLMKSETTSMFPPSDPRRPLAMIIALERSAETARGVSLERTSRASAGDPDWRATTGTFSARTMLILW